MQSVIMTDWKGEGSTKIFFVLSISFLQVAASSRLTSAMSSGKVANDSNRSTAESITFG